VQSRFFPTQLLQLPTIHLAGRSVPASECAGDWWHYAQVGEEIVIVIGDVTGHGVSAALVTAGAHSAFSLLIRNAIREGHISMERLTDELNAAVLAAANGQASMTLAAVSFHLRTGQIRYVNASHCIPYVHRRGKAMALMGGNCPALG